MALRNGPLPTKIPLAGEPRPLVATDLERLKTPRYQPAPLVKIRDAHHMIARLAATGKRPSQIAQLVGYSRERVTQLLLSPAMEELVATYRAKIDESFVESVDEFFNLATTNMLRSERMISDALEEAEETGERPSLRTLDAISQGRQDRFGYGKKTQNTNINIDFAAQLERAIARSGKTLEASAVQAEPNILPGSSQPAQRSPRPSPAADSVPRIRRRA